MEIPNWPQVSFGHQKEKPSLIRCLSILQALGNPQNDIPPTIHIAGTNGKGSTIAMLNAILTQGGYKVDTYTSPHILSFSERITLAGNNISPYYFYELLDQVKYAADQLAQTPSFFEGITIAAFLAFAQSKSDFLLLETGMGGEFDPTNIISDPILTIITPISYDHMGSLGFSLEEIAKAKAGIIKTKIPCVISSQTNEVYDILLNKCNELESPAFCYGYDYGISREENNNLSHNTTSFNYHSAKYTLNLTNPPLLGDHQTINASCVVAAIMLINSQLNLTKQQIELGLSQTKWPGRIEKIPYNKYQNLAPENVQIYLDGSHNESGARCLAIWAYENLPDPVYLILGMSKNRNAMDFTQYFYDFAVESRAVTVESEPYSYSADTLSEIANSRNFKILPSSSLSEAINDLSTLIDQKKANIIITGSLFLVSDFYKIVITD